MIYLCALILIQKDIAFGIFLILKEVKRDKKLELILLISLNSKHFIQE